MLPKCSARRPPSEFGLRQEIVEIILYIGAIETCGMLKCLWMAGGWIQLDNVVAFAVEQETPRGGGGFDVDTGTEDETFYDLRVAMAHAAAMVKSKPNLPKYNVSGSGNNCSILSAVGVPYVHGYAFHVNLLKLNACFL
jgi:hypothetical protein